MVSPPVLLGGGLVCALALVLYVDVPFWAVFGPGLLLSCSGLAVLASRHRLGDVRAGVSSALVVLGVGAGIAIGALLGLGSRWAQAGLHTGMGVDQVRAITGVVGKDSWRSRKGSWYCRLELCSVAGDDGALVDARGPVLVRHAAPSRDGLVWSMAQGMTVSMKGRMVPLEDDLLFVARDWRIVAEPSGPAAVRLKLLRSLRSVFSGLEAEAGGLALALLLGDRSHMSGELESLFDRTGTAHLLALSGLHLGLLAVFVVLVLKPFLSPGPRWGVLCVFAVVFLYVTGGRPSLVRATLMMVLGGAVLLFDRDRRPFDLLALVLTVHLILTPRELGGLGFQLSYLGLAGVLLGARRMAPMMERWVPPALAGPLGATLGAQALTLPVVAGVFAAWPSGSLAATLLGAPLIMVFLWSLLIGIPVMVLSPHHGAPLVSAILQGQTRLMIRGGRWLAFFPTLRVSVAVAFLVTGTFLVLALAVPGRARGR